MSSRSRHPIPSMACVLALLLMAALCSTGAQNRTASKALQLNTTAFEPGGNIPKKFTCDGLDVSPPLSWSEPPARTNSFALIADDPDAPAGVWVHWVVYNLPASTRQIPEDVPKHEEIQGGGRQGITDFGKVGYGGPCPPPGNPHRYFFKLYALDIYLELHSSATKKEVERAMKGHVLGHAELLGRYGR